LGNILNNIVSKNINVGNGESCERQNCYATKVAKRGGETAKARRIKRLV
jgi:hypothetical protein